MYIPLSLLFDIFLPSEQSEPTAGDMAATAASSFSAAAAAAARRSSPSHLRLLARRHLPFSSTVSFSAAAPPAAAASFGWEDALRVAADDRRGDESDLSGYFRKVDTCNRGMDKKGEFVEFMVEDQVVGYIHQGFVEHLETSMMFLPLPRAAMETIMLNM